MAALILSIMFLPLALLSAARIHPMLKPPKHRPIGFILFGTFSIASGLGTGYALRDDLKSGVIHFTRRFTGEFHADFHSQPLSYWSMALLLYVAAIVLVGFGLAGYALCFTNRQADASR